MSAQFPVQQSDIPVPKNRITLKFYLAHYSFILTSLTHKNECLARPILFNISIVLAIIFLPPRRTTWSLIWILNWTLSNKQML